MDNESCIKNGMHLLIRICSVELKGNEICVDCLLFEIWERKKLQKHNAVTEAVSEVANEGHGVI